VKKWVFVDAAAVHDLVRRGWDIHGEQPSSYLDRAVEDGDLDVVRVL
jgi:hypothetical protein